MWRSGLALDLFQRRIDHGAARLPCQEQVDPPAPRPDRHIALGGQRTAEFADQVGHVLRAFGDDPIGLFDDRFFDRPDIYQADLLGHDDGLFRFAVFARGALENGDLPPQPGLWLAYAPVALLERLGHFVDPASELAELTCRVREAGARPQVSRGKAPGGAKQGGIVRRDVRPDM